MALILTALILILRLNQVHVESVSWKFNNSLTFHEIGDAYCSQVTNSSVYITEQLKSWKFILFLNNEAGDDDESDEPPGQLILTFPENTIVDSSLSLIMDFMSSHNATILRLEYLKGVDLDFFAPLRHLDNLIELKTRFVRFQSTFTLYHNNEYILTVEKCNNKTYESLLTLKSRENVLSSFNQLIVSNSKNKLCKCMFQNINLKLLTIKTNYFELLDRSDQQQFLNSSISSLKFVRNTRLKLDKKNLDPILFVDLNSLILQDSTLLRVENDLFKSTFHNLRFILLQLINLESFLHGGGVGWIKNLNWDKPSLNHLNMSIKFIQANMITVEFREHLASVEFMLIPAKIYSELFKNNYYYFSAEDFCLFYDVPVERLVFFQITMTVYLDPESCILPWLYRYQHFYKKLGLAEGDLPANLTCNFTELVTVCNLSSQRAYTQDPYFMYSELGIGIDEAKVIIIDYMQPFVCVVCLFTNLLIILTIGYNQKRKNVIKAQGKNKTQEIILLDENLYKYILFNSILNSLFALVTLIEYSTPCHRVKYSDHDYDDYQLASNCSTRAIVFGVMSSTLELMSNFSYLQISLNRYLLVGKDHPEWTKKISQISMKLFLIITLVLSLGLSSHDYFQARIFVTSSLKSPLEELINPYYSYYYGSYSTVYRQNSLPLLFTLTLIHDVINYGLFCVLTLLLDILTVKKLHDALFEKQQVKGKDDKSRESERRSIIMVVVNSLVNFILRAPELVSVIFYNIAITQYGYRLKMTCHLYSNCLVIVNLSKTFVILSLSFGLLFYIKFNSVFRCSFQYFIDSILRKFKDKNKG